MTQDAPEAPTHPVPTPRPSRRVWLAVAAVAVAAVASGAILKFVFWPGPGPLTDPKNTSDGPLGTGGVIACVEPDTDFHWIGMSSLGNSGSAPLIIDRVEVGGVKDVEVVGTLAIPLEGEAAGVLAWGSPPTRSGNASVEEYIKLGVRLDQRKPAVGYQVARGDRPAALVVGLRPIGEKHGGIDSVTIYYHVGWRHFHKYAHRTIETYRKDHCGS